MCVFAAILMWFSATRFECFAVEIEKIIDMYVDLLCKKTIIFKEGDTLYGILFFIISNIFCDRIGSYIDYGFYKLYQV